MISLKSLFFRQLKREGLLQIRDFRTAINAGLFFLMLIVFFPLTLPVNSNILRIVAPGLIWVGVLLSLFLSSEKLFKQDYEDGIIEQWFVSPYPITIMVLAKISIHWLVNIIPVLLISPFMAILFKLSIYEIFILGSPAIVALCALSAGFSSGLKQKGVVMALILLPLAIPILILGSGSIMQGMHGEPVLGFLALLLAISLTSLALLPFAISGIIKISLVD